MPERVRTVRAVASASPGTVAPDAVAALLRSWSSSIALGGAGYAQGVSIAAPPDRFVAPGGFVTLVFRVEATAAVEVEVAVAVDAGWVVLRPPGRLALEAGRSTPDRRNHRGAQRRRRPACGSRCASKSTAPGVHVERVVGADRHRARGRRPPGARGAHARRRGLEVVVDQRRQRRGAARRWSCATTARSWTGGASLLAPGAREVARSTRPTEGLHRWCLTTERGDGGAAQRARPALRHGPGRAVRPRRRGRPRRSARRGRRALDVRRRRGALSDFVIVDARVDARVRGARSYALVEGDVVVGARAAPGGRTRSGCSCPSTRGVGSWTGDAVERGGVRRLARRRPVRRRGVRRVGVRRDRGGRRPGRPRRGRRRSACAPRRRRGRGSSCSATAGLRGRALGAALQAGRAPRAGRLAGHREGADLRAPRRGWTSASATASADTEVYADGTVPIGAWRLRVRSRRLPRRCRSRRSPARSSSRRRRAPARRFLRGGYRTEVGGGWRGGDHGRDARGRAGVRVTFDARSGPAGADPIDVDARFDYRPATGRVGGRVGARARFAAEPVDLSLAFGWDLGERDVAVGAVGAVGATGLVVGGRRDGRLRLRRRRGRRGPVACGRRRGGRVRVRPDGAARGCPTPPAADASGCSRGAPRPRPGSRWWASC